MTRRKLRRADIEVELERETEVGFEEWTYTTIFVGFNMREGTPSRGPDFNCSAGYPGEPNAADLVYSITNDGSDIELTDIEATRAEEMAWDEWLAKAHDYDDWRVDEAYDRYKDEGF
jgi:hypothetical protein